MDITLIKTFVEVANTGSFIAACHRLFVTQSAVSLRIQRLENELGHPLFVRSKAGAVLTPAGVQFERYALSLLNIWEEARQQIAIPAGFSRALTLGAEHALWPRLGFRWVDALQSDMPDLSIRAEAGVADRLTRLLTEGVMQAALVYTPQLRPGLLAENVSDDELIMVAARPGVTADFVDKYVRVDWGPEFIHAHALALPEFTSSGLTMALGALAGDYVVNRNLAAYIPARSAKRHLDQGKLHVVSDAPRFAYPVWAVWREDMDSDLADAARRTLAGVAQRAEIEQETVVQSLEPMNSGDTGQA